jgi:hypothetical protein
LFAEPANSMNSINLGIGGVVQTMPHCKADVFIAEYERMFGSKIALLGRISEVDYRFDDGKYLEEGRPKGVDIGARWYPAGGMKGFFIGGAVGYWMSDWTFTDFKGQPNEVQGRGDSDSIRVSLDIGGRFPIGSSSFSIIPALNVGRFFPSTTCEYTSPASKVGTSCSQRTEVENYLVLSVLAGIKF